MQSQYCNLQECVSDPKELCSVDLSKKDIYFLSVSGLRSKHVRNYLHLRLRYWDIASNISKPQES